MLLNWDLFFMKEYESSIRLIQTSIIGLHSLLSIYHFSPTFLNSHFFKSSDTSSVAHIMTHLNPFAIYYLCLHHPLKHSILSIISNLYSGTVLTLQNQHCIPYSSRFYFLHRFTDYSQDFHD